jgi:hypothetical protein
MAYGKTIKLKIFAMNFLGRRILKRYTLFTTKEEINLQKLNPILLIKLLLILLKNMVRKMLLISHKM